MTRTPGLTIEAGTRTRMSAVLAATVLTLGLGATLLAPSTTQARGFEATRLGSFLGAMRYCEDRYDERERRYRRARLRAAKELDDMDRHERTRALRARERAYERGQFLGNRLDRQECRSLLRASEWQQFSGD